MATNYAPLITEWTTLTGSATITTLAGAQAIPGYLATLDAMTVTGSIPTLGEITGLQFMSCLHWSEYAAQTVTVQATLNTLMLMPLISGGSASPFVAPMFAAIGATMPLTGAALAALATGLVQPWWQANGFASPTNINDLIAAGIVTQALAHSAGLV